MCNLPRGLRTQIECMEDGMAEAVEEMTLVGCQRWLDRCDKKQEDVSTSPSTSHWRDHVTK